MKVEVLLRDHTRNSTSNGGAATEYEELKRREYGRFLLPGQGLAPVIFDTFGATGETATPVLKRIALAYAARLGMGQPIGHMRFFAALNCYLMRSVARIAVGNTS